MTKNDAAHEAVITLGLLTAEAIPTVARLLRDDLIVHPRTIATDHRKAGEQPSADEKRALGIRSNAFLSRSALAEITLAGLADPLAAHETTLLRATFTMNRQRQMNEMEQHRETFGKALTGYLHSMSHDDCPACCRLDGLFVTTAADVAIMPPVDCAPGCTAGYLVQPQIDFLADLD